MAMDLYMSLVTIIRNKKAALENNRISEDGYKAHVINTTKKINILKEHKKLTEEQANELIAMM